MANIYVSSVAWTAVTAWAANTAYSVGNIRRQLATPTIYQERVFRCTTAGTSHATTEPTWVITVGATTTESTGVVWTEITGLAIYNGDGGGTAWGAPYARVASALDLGLFVAGDTMFVASNHTESATSATSWRIPGTNASPNRILSVDETIVPATNLTTLKVGATHTGNTSTSHIIAGSAAGAGVAYINGFTLQTATGAGSRNLTLGATSYPTSLTLDTCNIDIRTTGTSLSAGLLFSSGSTTITYTKIRLINCDIKFAVTAHAISLGYGEISLIGCTLNSTGAAPTTLFTTTTSSANITRISSCDFSKATSNLYTATTNSIGDINISQCKLGAGITFLSGTLNPGCTLRIQNCDSGATNYKDYLAASIGTIIQETTTVMTGGASDGTTPLSWNMTTNAYSQITNQLISDEICIWNEETGSSKDVTLEICGASELNNADVWIEVEHLGSSATPISTFTSSRVADVLTAGTAYPSSSKTWGGSPANKQYITVAITPQMKGWIKCRVHLGKASYTCYVNPVLAIT